MSWEGLEGLNLSDVEVKAPVSILGPGRHVVTIADSKVVANDSTKSHQLEIEYKNDTGTVRQWITLNHPTSADAVRIGKERLKSLLMHLGHDGQEAPSPDYFRGKQVGINIKEKLRDGKTRTEVNYYFTPPKEEVKKEKLDDQIPF